MNKFALLVRFEALPGKEAEVERLLTSALPAVDQELSTKIWYALRFGPRSYALFDTFPDEAGRDAHLGSHLEGELMERSAELLESPPIVEKLDVLTEKIAREESGIVGAA